MTEALREGFCEAFRVAAGELGMCAASWLFVRTAARESEEAVARMREALGREFPVFDAVAEAHARGERGLRIDITAVASALAGVTRVVIVGLEASHTDSLVARLTDVKFALVTQGSLPADWDRVIANHDGAVEPVDVGSFQSWAGPRSALLTFAYGVQGASTHVSPQWLRVADDDVRTQFRSLIAWNVLTAPMLVDPHWLVEVPVAFFTDVVS